MTSPAPLLPGHYYHLYNRGNNRENIFLEERNCHYFLKLYARHVEPIAETYAYCLLRNHFHFLVRMRDEQDLPESLSNLSQPFSNLFNAYAKSFNRTYERTGALFQRPFGRIPITSDAYFVQVIAYIHRNPQKHGFVKDFRDWPYSSYHAHLSNQPTHLKRAEVLAWFHGPRGFVNIHGREVDEARVEALLPDDFD